MSQLQSDAETFIGQQRSEHTQKAYRYDLTRWFAFLAGRDITNEIVLDFKRNLLDTLSESSAARTFNTVRVYYRWIGADTPFNRIKGPRRIEGWVPKVPQDEHVEALLEQVAYYPRERAIVLLLMGGLRLEEVVNLNHADVTYEPSVKRYVAKVVGKGQKMRLVPLNNEASAALLEHGLSDADEPLFTVENGDRITRRQVQWILTKFSRAAGVNINPHALRHHYATRLVRGGVNLAVVQRVLGHSRPETTTVYLGLDLTDIATAATADPRDRME
jgi:integrase/recombinase XerD